MLEKLNVTILLTFGLFKPTKITLLFVIAVGTLQHQKYINLNTVLQGRKNEVNSCSILIVY